MKKVLALVLAVVLAFGMASVGFASGTKIDGVNGDYSISDSALGSSFGYDFVNTSRTAYTSADNMEDVRPNNKTKIKFYLSVDNFTWDGAKPANLTSSMISSGNITAVLKKTEGYPTIKSASIKSSGSGANTKVWIEVEFISELVETKSVDFSYDLALAYKKTKNDDSVITIAGNMENPITEVDTDNDTAYTADGTVVEATDYVKSIDLEAGNGVHVIMNMFDDNKYYCKATMDIDAKDQLVADKYNQLDSVVTVNYKSTNGQTAFNSAKVYFDLPTTYYVYDKDGKYLGLSTDKLPFSDKFFLANSKIDMSTTDVTPEDGEEGGDAAPVDPSNPVTGGDEAVANATDNPGTGANGFVNVAVVAGVVALAAAGAVCLKK